MTGIGFDLRADIDRALHRAAYARDGRVQIRDVLAPRTAAAILDMLQRATPWGLAWQAAPDAPVRLNFGQYRAQSPEVRAKTGQQVAAAAAGGRYAFQYGQYPMIDAYREKWAEGGPHDWLIEHINDQPFLDLVRDVTGIAGLIKADAQATFYAPGHFLACHSDSHVAEGWRVAYVLNMASEEWQPDWGGYLNFLDDQGDVVAGWRPRFNALNLFAVPQAHQVTFVPPFAPFARFAVTGWLRDR